MVCILMPISLRTSDTEYRLKYGIGHIRVLQMEKKRGFKYMARKSETERGLGSTGWASRLDIWVESILQP